jgi:GNAT superfamily N-acetyltransferase
LEGNKLIVTLEKAAVRDAPVLFNMQKTAFTPLLEKYRDYETSPANETIERLISRITQRQGSFLKIFADGQLAGAINVKWKEKNRFWISPIFILPAYQGHGIAQEAIRHVELLFPQAASWELSTLLEEQGNCYLYEKMGYIQTGKIEQLNEQATLVYYKREFHIKSEDKKRNSPK